VAEGIMKKIFALLIAAAFAFVVFGQMPAEAGKYPGRKISKKAHLKKKVKKVHKIKKAVKARKIY
jgi:hypothetical protein